MGRKGKGIEEKVVNLLSKGLGYAEVAKEVYGEATRKTLSRVYTIAKKYEEKLVQHPRKNFSTRAELIRREYERFKELYRRLRKLGPKRDERLQQEIKRILLKRALKAQKDAEIVRRSFAQVESWLDHDLVARELAEECYSMARRCFEEGDIKNGQKFLELVIKFFKLSQKARFEIMAEEAQKALAKIATKNDAPPSLQSEEG
ncbi:MAG: hypothetical protein RMJ14_01850 [Nitrososphaerota archaeon]|nr:hypothetical protein [Aigarchaeota archaeon]MDW8076367.1 hypothetical protein [Nitrososphaerota archaeon]